MTVVFCLYVRSRQMEDLNSTLLVCTLYSPSVWLELITTLKLVLNISGRCGIKVLHLQNTNILVPFKER